ncbi:hypothetical protein [Moorena sp. SIOASIH]|nr:hypothetical protein [Moorena sp. SIOASIH]
MSRLLSSVIYSVFHTYEVHSILLPLLPTPCSLLPKTQDETTSPN